MVKGNTPMDGKVISIDEFIKQRDEKATAKALKELASQRPDAMKEALMYFAKMKQLKSELCEIQRQIIVYQNDILHARTMKAQRKMLDHPDFAELHERLTAIKAKIGVELSSFLP
jgi:uncharacterized protein YigA (DUF484 family)